MGMAYVEIVMRVEEEFEITIPDVDAQNLTTVGALADYVASKFVIVDREAVLQRVRFLVAEEASIAVELVQRESRFVEDLDLG
jgi:acyl carrier protein